jgi:hypothetical protein
MKWSVFLGLLVLVGCESGTEVRPEPQPAPATSPPPAAEPEAQDDGGAIVLKGSSSRSPDAAPREDPARRNQDRIEELKRQAAEGGTTGSWSEFASTEGGFRVLLPEAPKGFAKAFPLPDGSRATLHMAMVELTKPEERAYFVGWMDLPDARKQTTDKILDQVAKAQAARGTLAQDKPITVDGNEGRETEIVVPAGITIRTRVFLVRSRLYEVVASARTASAQSRDIFRFLESLKITR